MRSNFKSLASHIKVHIEEAILEERERCAKIADEYTKRSKYPWSEGGEYSEYDYKSEGSIASASLIAQAIRGRK